MSSSAAKPQQVWKGARKKKRKASPGVFRGNGDSLVIIYSLIGRGVPKRKEKKENIKRGEILGEKKKGK